MKIAGWECVVGLGDDRGASHPDEGSLAFFGGQLIGSGSAPREVVQWLMRPQLRHAWIAGYLAASIAPSTPNPYDGEPLNKDRDPS